MFTSLQLLKRYFRFYRRACNGKGHGMHSPFVFDFILHVLNNRTNDVPPPAIEALRKQLLSDENRVVVNDLGAGSRVSTFGERSVKEIARTALKSEKLAQLLYRLVAHYKPRTIVELGTSLGITTSYFAAAAPGAEIITIEGSSSIAAIARNNFASLKYNNIRMTEGNFDDVLPSVLSNFSHVDMAYIDGNHRYQPTMDYFEKLLAKSHDHTILIFDDIHWSSEMEKAWKEIQNHSSVRYTIDIFYMGFVLFRKAFKTKQNFTVRF